VDCCPPRASTTSRNGSGHPDHEPAASGPGDRRDLIPHRQRQACDRLEVIRTWHWNPPVTISASPIILIFSTPSASASRSNAEKI
jgi:hypothetical protein